MSKRQFLRIALSAAALTLTGNQAFAETYPTKPIRLVVGFPAGGSSDFVARLLAPRLSKQLGVPVVVENKGGATGNIAAEGVARSRPAP